MLKKNAGLWAGIITLGFSLLFFVTSLQYSFLSDRGIGPGPGFLPLWLSGLMGILAILLMIDALRKPTWFSMIIPKKPEAKKIALVFGSVILFLAIVSYAGFIISTTIMLFLLLRGSYRWFISLGTAAGTSILLYWVFVILLKVTLPVNALGW